MTTRERDRNRYGANCLDCGEYVEAEQGRLYRHSGSNMSVGGRAVKRRRGAKYGYTVRCEGCYLKHDKPKEVTEGEATYYSGYGQNTHAICGN